MIWPSNCLAGTAPVLTQSSTAFSIKLVGRIWIHNVCAEFKRPDVSQLTQGENRDCIKRRRKTKRKTHITSDRNLGIISR
jgi:hypothetical protein